MFPRNFAYVLRTPILWNADRFLLPKYVLKIKIREHRQRNFVTVSEFWSLRGWGWGWEAGSGGESV